MNRLFIVVTLLSVVVCLGLRWYYTQTISIEQHLRQYTQTKQQIQEKRFVYEEDLKRHPEKQTVLQNMASNYLYTTLTDSIYPYWYGTTWDFNGTTRQPKKGKIACGYFVTTTLEDCGFYLPRVKLAQQAASVIIRSLCTKKSIKTFNKLTQLKAHMDRQPEGIYILGLDTHVGFLWNTKKELYFVHASYSGNRQVSKENWDESTVMQKSKLFVVGDLLGNKTLMHQWITGANIGLKK